MEENQLLGAIKIIIQDALKGVYERLDSIERRMGVFESTQKQIMQAVLETSDRVITAGSAIEELKKQYNQTETDMHLLKKLALK